MRETLGDITENHMKHLTIILFFVSLSINAQNKFEKNIQKSTNTYRELFLNKDFEKLADYANPKLITHLGSKEDFVYLLSELIKSSETKGSKVTDITFDKSSEIYTKENELQCTIPFELKIENDKKLVTFSAGLALVSFDNGENWNFAFRVEKDDKINNEILGLNEKIIIAQRTQRIIDK